MSESTNPFDDIVRSARSDINKKKAEEDKERELKNAKAKERAVLLEQCLNTVIKPLVEKAQEALKGNNFRSELDIEVHKISLAMNNERVLFEIVDHTSEPKLYYEIGERYPLERDPLMVTNAGEHYWKTEIDLPVSEEKIEKIIKDFIQQALQNG